MKTDFASMSLSYSQNPDASKYLIDQTGQWYALLALVLLYSLLFFLYHKVKKKKQTVVPETGRLHVLSMLRIGRRERVMEIQTRTGVVLVLLSEQGVALAMLPAPGSEQPVFNEVLEKKYRGA